MVTEPDAELLLASRQAWAALETLHVVGYFVPETRDRYLALGLDDATAYVPSRAAAMGEAGVGLTVAAFYVFAPRRVAAALPAAWGITAPAALLRARRDGVTEALRRVLGSPEVGEALEIARDACSALTAPGRPLYAAHADLPWPGDDLTALWHAATLVREHRGDGHLSVLQLAGLDPVEATVVGGLWSGTTRFLRRTRGWTEAEHDAAAGRLRERGWLGDDGQLSEDGQERRRRLERETDRLAVEGWAHVGLERTARLRDLLDPLRRQVREADVLPRSLRG